jgi:hypothetical protein
LLKRSVYISISVVAKTRAIIKPRQHTREIAEMGENDEQWHHPSTLVNTDSIFH